MTYIDVTPMESIPKRRRAEGLGADCGDDIVITVADCEEEDTE